jgi:UDP-N-acetylglucosamine transferase subunit ALG13
VKDKKTNITLLESRSKIDHYQRQMEAHQVSIMKPLIDQYLFAVKVGDAVDAAALQNQLNAERHKLFEINRCESLRRQRNA